MPPAPATVAGLMSESANISPVAPSIESSAKRFTAEDEAFLKDSLRRCSPASYEAAVQFRKTGNPEFVPAILLGIIERFVEPDLRPKLREADDELRIIEDLGIDSLTMMEIVILAEGVLQMSINNDELRNLRTIGDIKGFIDSKLRGLPPPAPQRFVPIETITELMPVQAPFLFLNEASLSADSAKAKYRISGQEFFLQGHFKGNPVMPASIMSEALGQLAMLFLINGMPVEEGKRVDPASIYFASSEGVRAHRVCKPGDTLSLSIKLKRSKLPLATFEGSIRVGQEKALIVEELTLTFAFVDVIVPPAPLPVPAVS